MGIFSYKIHTILCSNVIHSFYSLMPSLNYIGRYVLNKNISKKNLGVLFLDLKFCKNLGFSLSEHCEWSTKTLQKWIALIENWLPHIWIPGETGHWILYVVCFSGHDWSLKLTLWYYSIHLKPGPSGFRMAISWTLFVSGIRMACLDRFHIYIYNIYKTV